MSENVLAAVSPTASRLIDYLKSFYFYVLPFNDGETDKKDIMEAVLKGDVDL